MKDVHVTRQVSAAALEERATMMAKLMGKDGGNAPSSLLVFATLAACHRRRGIEVVLTANPSELRGSGSDAERTWTTDPRRQASA